MVSPRNAVRLAGLALICAALYMALNSGSAPPDHGGAQLSPATHPSTAASTVPVSVVRAAARPGADVQQAGVQSVGAPNGIVATLAAKSHLSEDQVIAMFAGAWQDNEVVLNNGEVFAVGEVRTPEEGIAYTIEVRAAQPIDIAIGWSDAVSGFAHPEYWTGYWSTFPCKAQSVTRITLRCHMVRGSSDRIVVVRDSRPPIGSLQDTGTLGVGLLLAARGGSTDALGGWAAHNTVSLRWNGIPCTPAVALCEQPDPAALAGDDGWDPNHQ